MKHLAIVAALAISAPLAAGAAPILVDDYSFAGPDFTLSAGTGGTGSSTDAGILGGTRNENVANTGSSGIIFGGAPFGDVFFLEGTVGATGFARMDYFGSGFDLVDGTNDRFLVDVSGATDGTQIAVIASGVEVTKVLSGIPTAPLEFSFAEFAGVDFTNVGFFSLELRSRPSGGDDIAVDNFRVGTAATVVPLPAGGVLLLTGLGALALRRRKS